MQVFAWRDTVGTTSWGREEKDIKVKLVCDMVTEWEIRRGLGAVPVERGLEKGFTWNLG